MHVRSLSAVVLAALLAAPAAHAQAKKSSAKAGAKPAAAPAAKAAATRPSIDGWIGYESDELGGFQLRGDYVLPTFRVLAPDFDVAFVGEVGVSRISQSESLVLFKVDNTAWLFKFIPTARFTYSFPQDRRFSVFGDAGLGLTYTSLSTETDYGGGITGSASDSSLGVTLRLGAGGFFRLDPKWQLGATVVFDPTTGDYGFDTWSILVGAKYQL